MLVTFRPTNNVLSSRNHFAQSKAAPHFASILPYYEPETKNRYINYHKTHDIPDLLELHAHAGALNRTMDINTYIGMLLNYDRKPTHIYLGGGSDGTEADGMGMYAAKYLPRGVMRDPDQLLITSGDRDPAMCKLAQSGFRVHSQNEKTFQDDEHTPAEGEDGWNKHFVRQKSGPPDFSEWVTTWPKLAHMTWDKVMHASIENRKLWWDKIRPKNLPQTRFRQVAMQDFVKEQPSKHKRQIYVLSNSWAYMLAIKPAIPPEVTLYVGDPDKFKKFAQVVRDIKENNKGKEVIIAVGEMEQQVFRYLAKEQPNFFKDTGMKEVTAEEMKAMGITDANCLRVLEKKIWRLET